MNTDENITRLADLQRTEVASGGSNFSLKDQKGRLIGYKWNIQRVTGRLVTDQEVEERHRAGKWYACWAYPAGWPETYYEVRASVTRDGNSYGPTVVKNNNFRTLAEAHAAVAKRTINSRKSNTRKFAKEPA